MNAHSKASYGLDAPGFLIFALPWFVLLLIVGIVSRRPGPWVGAVVLLWCVGFFLHTTRRGKFVVWRELLGDLRLRGDERILDLGCGRGAVLLSAAKQLTTGQAVGVDIWSRADQSGNSPRAAIENSQIEGVRERVLLVTGDMTALPFPSASFDVIVSNVAIHNIKGLSHRLTAIDEAVRVLRPGGRLVLADLRSTSAYAARLAARGMANVERRGLGWRMWWGGPWGATRVVTATKAATAALVAVLLLSPSIHAHPGSGIAVDRRGQVFLVDMVDGIWKIDTHGALTHVPGPGFHWMALDADERLGRTRLPSGPGGDVARVRAEPTVILASDYPIAIGPDGNLYFAPHGSPVQLLKMLPSGESSPVVTLPATTAGSPIRDVDDLAAAPDGSLYYTEPSAIRRVSKEGQVSIVAQDVSPDPCGPVPGIGPADRPLLRGLDVDAKGTVYVAATGCGSVLRVTPEGRVSILFQTEPPWSPTGITLSGNDVYVLEFLGVASDNRREMVPRVRKIAADGKTAILATVRRG